MRKSQKLALGIASFVSTVALSSNAAMAWISHWDVYVTDNGVERYVELGGSAYGCFLKAGQYNWEVNGGWEVDPNVTKHYWCKPVEG